MVQHTRFTIGLLAVSLAALLIVGYFVVRPLFFSERSIRISLTESLTKWTGATLTVSGRVRLSYFPRLQMELKDVRMSGITDVPAISELRADRVDVRLGLWSLFSGDPVIDRLTLIAPVIEARTAGKDKASSAQTGAAAALKALSRAPFDQIVIENGEIIVSGPQTKEEFTSVTGKLNLAHLGGMFSGRGSFGWRGQSLSFRYDSGTVEKTGNALRMPIVASVDSKLLNASVNGTATLTNGLKVDGTMDLQVPNLPTFARWTGVLLPDDMKQGTFEANGVFHWAGHTIGFDEGTFVLDGNKALGAIALEFAGPRPQIEGTLALQKLDLTQYLQSDTAETNSANSPTKTETAKSVPMDFPLLHHINLDLRISTTELTASRLSVGQSALSVALQSGRLAADIAVFDFCGGSGTGRIEFDATVPDSQFHVTANLLDVLAESCIELFASQSPIKGTADLTADLTSKGRIANDLVASLRGKATVEITDGQVLLDPPKLLADLREGPLKGWQAVSGDAADFSALSGTLFFRGGSIYTDSLNMTFGPDVVRTEGTVELANDNLDLRLEVAKITAEANTPGQPDAKPVESKIVGAIVIKGPWSNPIFDLEQAKSNAQMKGPLTGSRAASLGDHY